MTPSRPAKSQKYLQESGLFSIALDAEWTRGRTWRNLDKARDTTGDTALNPFGTLAFVVYTLIGEYKHGPARLSSSLRWMTAEDFETHQPFRPLPAPASTRLTTLSLPLL